MSNETREIMAAFFEAMQKGYARGEKPFCNKAVAGEKYNSVIAEGGLVVVDRWRTSEGVSTSYGRTIISAPNGKELWVMQYAGWYHADVIQFLKQALWENYSEKVFLGGRGPMLYSDGIFTYHNAIYGKNDPDRFQGEEQIHRSNQLMGIHSYHGHRLV